MSESSIQSFPGHPASRALGTLARRSIRAASGESSHPPSSAARAVDERALVARTLAGDPVAFGELVDRHHASFLRLARAWGHDGAAAEEIVKTCWLAILDGLEGFQFDGSLRAWMMRVVAGHAARSSERARASAGSVDEEGARDGNGPERFDADGRWSDPPVTWGERSRADDDVAAAVAEAISHLPSAERALLTLRDVEGLGAEEACAVLDLGIGAQHALLDRGRRRVRRALDAVARTTRG